MGRLIAAALTVYSFILVQTSIATLPARIPTHFNALGEADGWGAPDILWMLLLLQTFLCIAFSFLPHISRRHPRSVHVGTRKLSDFTPEQQEKILPLLSEMMGALSVPISLLFSYIIHGMIRVAVLPHPRLPFAWPLGLFILSDVVTLVYYLRRIQTIANRAALSPGAAS